MLKGVLFQIFTIWVYFMFCLCLLWCKVINIFVNMELAIKLLYVGMSFLCENVVRVEENWMNRFMCSRHCSKNSREGIEDDSESFDDFIKKINNNSAGPRLSLSPSAGAAATRNAQEVNKGMSNIPTGPPFNSAQVSTLNFPNPSNQPQSGQNAGHSSSAHGPASNFSSDDVDHEKIKKLIDKLYMNTIVERSEEDNDGEDEEISLGDEKYYKNGGGILAADRYSKNNSRHSDDDYHVRSRRPFGTTKNVETIDDDNLSTRMFPRTGAEPETKQIIFSRGLKEMDAMIPQPN